MAAQSPGKSPGEGGFSRAQIAAKQNNISYEAVRKQVARYKDELKGHLIKEGRQQFLDESKPLEASEPAPQEEATEEESIVFKPDTKEPAEDSKDESDNQMVVFVVVIVVVAAIILLALIVFLILNMMKKKREADEFRMIDRVIMVDERMDLPRGNGGSKNGKTTDNAQRPYARTGYARAQGND